MKIFKSTQRPQRMGFHMAVAVVVCGLTIAFFSLVAGLHNEVPKSDSHLLDAGIPTLSQVPSVLSPPGWTTFQNMQDGYSLQLPESWTHAAISSGDPDDGYYVSLSNPADRTVTALLAVSSSETGEGTPGPLTDARPVSYNHVAMRQLTWQSSSQQLLQYRFTHNDQYFLLQVQAPRADQPAFDSLRHIASRFSFLHNPS